MNCEECEIAILAASVRKMKTKFLNFSSKYIAKILRKTFILETEIKLKKKMFLLIGFKASSKFQANKETKHMTHEIN